MRKVLLGVLTVASAALLALSFVKCDSDTDSGSNTADTVSQSDIQSNGGGGGGTTITDTTSNNNQCQPNCAGKECGDDGCGGSCGTCDPGYTCQNGKCVCQPNCAGKECGDDGCGGSCGTCGPNETCVNGVCQPQGGVCGDGKCDPGEDYQTCPADCNCVPDCTGKECGDDGCGGTCGMCPAGQVCQDGICVEQQGTLSTCLDVYLCMYQCEPNDQACMQSCLGQASPDAAQQLQAMVTCWQQAGLYNCPQNDTECVENVVYGQCKEQTEACLQGDYSCAEILNCLNGCAQNDEFCAASCVLHGTIEAQNQFQAIIDCLAQQCGEQPAQDCINQALQGPCATEFNACLGAM